MTTAETRNCATCLHAMEKSTFPECAACFGEMTHDDKFPRWVPKPRQEAVS